MLRSMCDWSTNEICMIEHYSLATLIRSETSHTPVTAVAHSRTRGAVIYAVFVLIGWWLCWLVVRGGARRYMSHSGLGPEIQPKDPRCTRTLATLSHAPRMRYTAALRPQVPS